MGDKEDPKPLDLRTTKCACGDPNCKAGLYIIHDYDIPALGIYDKNGNEDRVELTPNDIIELINGLRAMLVKMTDSEGGP